MPENAAVVVHSWVGLGLTVACGADLSLRTGETFRAWILKAEAVDRASSRLEAVTCDACKAVLTQRALARMPKT